MNPGTSAKEMLMLVARLVLGVVFIFASIEKLGDPQAFAAAISNYKILSTPSILLAIATILPWVELLTGFGLVFGVFVRGSALLAMGMMLAFIGLVLLALLRGLDISCGCFTNDPAVGKIGWWKFGENLALLAMAYLSFRFPGERFSLERFLGNHTPNPDSRAGEAK